MDLDNSEFSLQQCLEESMYTVLLFLFLFLFCYVFLSCNSYTILPVARQKKLELILDIDAHVIDRILGDMIRLRQVMLNLLNNAVKVSLFLNKTSKGIFY